MIIKLFQLVFSKSESGLWWDHDRRGYDENGWGVVLKFFAGSFARPVPKFWTKLNPWQEESWFTIRLPFVILPFFSICLGGFGFYLGGKVFTVDEDEPWSRDVEHGTDMLTISASLRRTRWK